jgi:hypothetical protein
MARAKEREDAVQVLRERTLPSASHGIPTTTTRPTLKRCTVESFLGWWLPLLLVLRVDVADTLLVQDSGKQIFNFTIPGLTINTWTTETKNIVLSVHPGDQSIVGNCCQCMVLKFYFPQFPIKSFKEIISATPSPALKKRHSYIEAVFNKVDHIKAPSFTTLSSSKTLCQLKWQTLLHWKSFWIMCSQNSLSPPA